MQCFHIKHEILRAGFTLSAGVLDLGYKISVLAEGLDPDGRVLRADLIQLQQGDSRSLRLTQETEPDGRALVLLPTGPLTLHDTVRVPPKQRILAGEPKRVLQSTSHDLWIVSPGDALEAVGREIPKPAVLHFTAGELVLYAREKWRGAQPIERRKL